MEVEIHLYSIRKLRGLCSSTCFTTSEMKDKLWAQRWQESYQMFEIKIFHWQVSGGGYCKRQVLTGSRREFGQTARWLFRLGIFRFGCCPCYLANKKQKESDKNRFFLLFYLSGVREEINRFPVWRLFFTSFLRRCPDGSFQMGKGFLPFFLWSSAFHA